MAHLTCTYRSLALMGDTTFHLILPDDRKRGESLPVLYLLHGYLQGADSWSRFSSVEEFVSGSRLAVVMPDGANSFYCDMVYGGHYATFITRELPRFCASQFGTSRKREDTFLAGLSMGGYGALKIGLSNPQLYAAIGAFSPACDAVKITTDNPTVATSIIGNVGGETLRNNPKYDLYEIMNRAAAAPARPWIYHFCGDDDFLLEENLAFSAFAAQKPEFDYTYVQTPGDHSWPYWNREAQVFINKILATR